mmetsp:Transcript_149301/g.479415  ORF Transcript_149301/g.479415 Transcript_149301/m.479415 type:complete len:277 (+) Transcript_149301:784-1614(+)
MCTCRHHGLCTIRATEDAHDEATAGVEALLDVSDGVADLADTPHVLDPELLHESMHHVWVGAPLSHLVGRNVRVHNLVEAEALHEALLDVLGVARVEGDLDVGLLQFLEIAEESDIDVADGRSIVEVCLVDRLHEGVCNAQDFGLELGLWDAGLPGKVLNDSLLFGTVPRVHVMVGDRQATLHHRLLENLVNEAALIHSGASHVTNHQVDVLQDSTSHALRHARRQDERRGSEHLLEFAGGRRELAGRPERALHHASSSGADKRPAGRGNQDRQHR